MEWAGDRSARRIALAAVAGAHGVKGELRLKLFSDNAASLQNYATLLVGGTQRRLMSIRSSGANAVARFEGICDRSAAETLRGSLVEIERAMLPPLAEGEFYYADLIGLPAVDRQGGRIGTVVAVENYGAGDLREIETADDRRSLVPFREGIADLDQDQIVLDPTFLV